MWLFWPSVQQTIWTLNFSLRWGRSSQTQDRKGGVQMSEEWYWNTPSARRLSVTSHTKHCSNNKENVPQLLQLKSPQRGLASGEVCSSSTNGTSMTQFYLPCDWVYKGEKCMSSCPQGAHCLLREVAILWSSSRNSNLFVLSPLPHQVVRAIHPSAHYECRMRDIHRILESTEMGTFPDWVWHSALLLRELRRYVWILTELVKIRLRSKAEEELVSTRAKRLYLWVVVGEYYVFSADREQSRNKEPRSR